MKRFFSVVIVLMLGLSLCGCRVEYATELTSTEPTTEYIEHYTVRFRYDDAKYEDYFKYCADVFERDNENTEVILECVTSEDYVQNILRDTTEKELLPDVYLASDSDLGSLYMLGLALPVPDGSEWIGDGTYGFGALKACRYSGNLIAYPLGFSTTVLLYNKDFLTAETVSAFSKIQPFSDNADFAGEDVSLEGIFKCDINQLFLNYGFIGGGISVGGECGDDKDAFDVSSDSAVACAMEYLSVIDYFSLDNKLSAEDCLDKFVNVSILATIVSTDMLKKLKETELNYGIAAFPDYSDSMETAPLAITSAVAVNPFSGCRDKAAEFAEYVTMKCADRLYEITGVLPAASGVTFDNPEYTHIYDSYDKSVPKIKLQYGEQVYALLEIALHNIILGNPPKDELQSVNDYMILQIE